MGYPIQSYSWEILAPEVAVKRMDKSSFLHHGAVIPKDISFFFDLNPEDLAESRPATLLCGGQVFDVYFQMDTQHFRYRLFWRSDFSETIKNKFPDLHQAYSEGVKDLAQAPLMRFEKLSESKYSVDLILANVIRTDVEEEIQQEAETRPEGEVKTYYGKRYERDPSNRRRAIAFHGLRCAACGFDFEETYGVRGAGFIEIHHNKPLAEVGAPQLIDPEKDLIPLCANCHRMVHRYRDHVITLEELKETISPNKATGETGVVF